MVKLIFVIAAFVVISVTSYAQSFEGDYYLGDEKVSITMDENSYYIVYAKDNTKRLLQYEENTPENEQIWLEWQNAKQTGTLILKSDYSTGRYTDYRTGTESFIKKIN